MNGEIKNMSKMERYFSYYRSLKSMFFLFSQDLSLKAGWDNVAEVPLGQPTKFKVDDLVAKKTYKFRIRAVNKIGSSEPGLFAKPVLAKDPWGKFNDAQ